MNVIKRPWNNITMGVGQDHVNPLPAHRSETGTVTSAWMPDEAELEMIKEGYPIILRVETYGQPVQPVSLSVEIEKSKVPVEKFRTALGNILPDNCLGVLSLCEFTRGPKTFSIKVIAERFYETAFEATEAYANTPNPESQLVKGSNREELIIGLARLYVRMGDQNWLRSLSDTI